MNMKNGLRTDLSMDREVCEHFTLMTQHCEACSSSPEAKVYNTTVNTKAAYFDDFATLISNQFTHGGAKYAIKGLDGMEATDVISAAFGGESQFEWVLGTMTKYIFRFQNFKREKDLLKIATYAYLLWLKAGFHKTESHDTDTSK